VALRGQWRLKTLVWLVFGVGLLSGGFRALVSPNPDDPLSSVLALGTLLAVPVCPFALIWRWAESTAGGS
jgi:hypothetical protein